MPADALGALATALAGLFAGGSLYVSLVQEPAAQATGPAAHHRLWVRLSTRCSRSLGVLAATGSLAALACALTQRHARLSAGAWATAAACLGSTLPYSLTVLARTRTALMDAELERGEGNKRALLAQWDRLHSVRTGAGLLAFSLMLTVIARRPTAP